MVWITLPGIYVDKFCHIVTDPLCAHHGPHFEKLWFWRFSEITQPSLGVKCYENFLCFCLQSNEIRISSIPFQISTNMKSEDHH